MHFSAFFVHKNESEHEIITAWGKKTGVLPEGCKK
jgi:hypothetical protein